MFSSHKIMFSSNMLGDYIFPELSTKNYYAWGKNDQYQHGDGTNLEKNSPSLSGQWAKVRCGAGHCIALNSDGRMFGWGSNEYNQLGSGDEVFTSPVVSPIEIYNAPVPNVDGWLAVSCGGAHNAAINIDRTLWGWGLNDRGQAGVQGSTPTGPARIAIGSWIHVACGRNHSFAIRSDRTLWGWGDSAAGQVKNTSFLTSPTLVDTAFGPVPFGGIKHVSCGWFHTAAIKMDGSLWAWGRNDSGQLGNGVTNNSAVGLSSPNIIGEDYDWDSVSCGAGHCSAIKRDGTLWTWGRGTEGQLGLGSTVQGATVPTKVGNDKWKKVSCGSYFTAGIKEDGALWTWGHNIWDQLGLGSSYSLTDRVYSPAIVSSPNVAWDDLSCSETFMVATGSPILSAKNVGEKDKLRGIPRILSFLGIGSK